MTLHYVLDEGGITMKLSLEMNLDNDAFVSEDNEYAINCEEVARILNKLSNMLMNQYDGIPLENSGIEGNLKDINGNKVGSWEIKED